MTTNDELRALVGAVRDSLDGLLYRGKSANATAEDEAWNEAYYTVDPALSDLEAALTGPLAQGWVMVPRVATLEMRAVLTAMLTRCHSVEESYADLIAAAPPQTGVG